MSENKPVFPCGHPDPIAEITYSVADEQKIYLVCKSCSELEYFRKYIIEKKEIATNSQSHGKSQVVGPKVARRTRFDS
ncbi:MAG: hypothetical protein HY222_01605 [Thaumarchaeota archaeon]|nr:hypothetical protein [Nitrososphaerota archaeon]MBI3641070.1 hypothetical protein [Nitrososphaerota archaeon]